MKVFTTAAVMLLSLLFVACVPSLQSFYETKDLVFEKRLLGTWTDIDGKESWHFERRGQNQYRMIFTDEKGDAGKFDASLFRLDGRTLLDVVPIPDHDNRIGQFLAAHTLMAVSIDDSRARLSYFDTTWLKRLLEKDPEAVRHTTIDGAIVLTDTTAKMQSFLKKHLDTPGAFEGPEDVIKMETNK